VRKKQTLLICAVCALLAFLALLPSTSTTTEPFYDGHPLSYWVANLSLHSVEDDWYEKATNAIDHIGVAALPFARKWIQYKPQQWRPRVGNWLNGTKHFPFARQLSSWILDPRPEQFSAGAYYVFPVLGKRALPALDDLCCLLNDTNRPTTSRKAASALGCLGTNALGPLLTVATNAQHPSRLEAIYAISVMPDLGDAAQILIPVITNCLNAPNPAVALGAAPQAVDPDVQMNAIFSLSNLKPQISVPLLVSYLNSPKTKDPLHAAARARVRLYSAFALGQMGPSASAAIPALTNALADPDLRNYAAEALHKIDPATFTDTPSQKLKAFPF
jgi:hypothetical protein